MSFSSVINLGTVSAAITSVKLLSCTNSSCTEGTVITGFDNVSVSSFPRTVTGIPDAASHIKVEALGACAGTSQCLLITDKPGTPTPTPTATGAPTPTPTVTPTPTPTPTSQTMVWNLNRCSDGANANQVIAYSSNYDPGVVIKGSNNICYTIVVTGYSMAPPITVVSEHSNCADCISSLVTVNYYQYDVVRSSIPNANGGFFNYIDANGATQQILQNTPGVVGRYCMRENSYQNNQYNLYTFTQVGICGPN